LGARKLKEFNLALLGKWCWRLLVDRGGFWYRVLVAMYGELGGRLEVRGRSVSCWWREVSRIRDRVGDGGSGWFDDQVLRRVGDGFDTSFWCDRWLGAAPLCERFRRLYELTENKFMSVADLLSVDAEQWGVVWRWRRRLWQWEEELAECRALLLDVSLNSNVSDSWVWLPDPSHGYTVRGAYSLLTSQVPHVDDSALDLVWHKQVPFKVSIFAWRLIRDRLPTKTNLIARRVLSADRSLCVAGCGHPETAQHLFLLCDTFSVLWHMLRDWIGCWGVDANNISDHFFQFTHAAGGGNARRSFMQLLWLLCAWVVWNERNN